MKYGKLAGLLVFALSLCGCASETAEENHEMKHTPAKEDIVISNVNMSDELMENFHSFEERLTKSDAIVYGEVTDFEMLAPDGVGTIVTRKTFHVIETLYGDIEPGSDLTISETGGYMTIADYIDSLDEIQRQWLFPDSSESPVSGLSDEEKKTKYISEVWDGYFYPEIGERAVYCIKKRNDDETIWRIAGAWQGKYREIEDGVLLKPNQYHSLSHPALIEGVERIGYEELKEMIHNAQQ